MKIAIFRRGLKKSVKVELIRYTRKIKDIEDLIEASINIDDKLYELAIEERYNYILRSSTRNYTSRVKNRSSYRKKFRLKSDPYRPELIELDFT